MHSRKSIFYKGIVFIASVFAMAIFSFTKAEATCDVVFSKNDQYVTLAGNLIGWSDSNLEMINTEDNCSEFGIEEVWVNGEKTGLDTFVAKGRNPGHYTVEYKYKYEENSSVVRGSVFRYVQILSSFDDNSENYTLGVFKGSATEAVEVIESFYAGNNRFVNVLKHTSYDRDGNVVQITSSISVSDNLGKNLDITGNGLVVMRGSDLINVERAFQYEGTYYLVGNTQSGKGVVLTYGLSGNVLSINDVVDMASTNSKYNSIVVSNDGNKVYAVGKNAGGYPVIEMYDKATDELQELYVHSSVPGEYTGITINGNNIYAVGYTKEANQAYTKGLYTEININDPSNPFSSNVLTETVDTKFYDIINAVNANIIVGSTKQSAIYFGGSKVENTTGTDDAVVLQLGLTNMNTVEKALMYGATGVDAFYRIRSGAENEYIVSGLQGASGLVISFKTDLAEVKDIFSEAESYKLNGVSKWENGYVYYGAYDDQIDSKLFIKGIYHPFELDGKTDGLFLVHDSRVINNHKTEVVQLRQNTAHDYNEFALKYGNAETLYYAGTGAIDTASTGENIMNYIMNVGRVIYVYRNLYIVESINAEHYPLDTVKMGILKWYLYDRSSTYIQDNGKRFTTTDFGYRITATEGLNSVSSIEEMIRYYLQAGNTQGYTLNYVLNASEGVSEYKKVDQTKAAFATSEYAKMFAYYQEFGRVIRLDGTKDYREEYGAYAYPGAEPVKGQAYYIYYIDYRGANSSSDVTSCSVSSGRVENCANKGGYAFNNLNAVKSVIENFLAYNNYFMTVKNYIYEPANGVEAAKVDYYKQNLTTNEYVKSLAIPTKEVELELNVSATGVTNVVSRAAKNLYFGGSLNAEENIVTYNGINYSVVKMLWDNDKEIYYYESTTGLFFLENLCYKVYYSSNSTTGSAREFCLDTKAPEIMYRKEGSDKVLSQSKNSISGTVVGNPLRIERNFQIVGLLDLDEYAYIRANGQVYTLACTANYLTGEKSQECLDNANAFINRSFKYDIENPMGVKSITFSDRLGNSNTFYFVVGTDAPHVSIPRYDQTGFTLVIDFYRTNPITSITTEIYQQMCAASAGENCYTPGEYENENPISNTNVHKQFTEALQNYIRAISYRDAGDIEGILTVTSDENGAYTFVRMVEGEERNVKYIIKDGYFVEHEGYQEKLITLNEQNVFTYKEKAYAYDKSTAKICLVSLNNDAYELNCTPETEIILQEGVFRFEPDGNRYMLVETEESTTIEVLPKKYPIDENNKFEIEKNIYTIDYDAGVITYENPLLSTMKHIELDFTRTVVEGKELKGGVNIPNTKPYCGDKVKEEDCNADKALIDASTNLPIYVLVGDDSYTHFDLVDGLYKFTISQLFSPYSETVRASLNVEELNITLGVHKKEDLTKPLEVFSGVDLRFDIEEDIFDNPEDPTTVNTIAVKKISEDDSFKYPLSGEDIFNKSSNLINTRFVPQTVYAAIQMDALGELVFTVEVCDVDLFANPESDCTNVAFYGSAYEKYDFSTLPIQADKIQYMSSVNNLELAELGIVPVIPELGTFAFNRQKTFYSVSISHWTWRNEHFEPDNEAIKIYQFYIDTMKPNGDTLSDKNTVSAEVYDGDKSISSEFPFVGNPDEGYKIINKNQTPEEDEEKNKDINTIGGNKKVHFTFNWAATRDADDYRENQLLMMTVNGVTCNVHYLIQAAKELEEYTTKCLEYIDIEETKKNNNTLVFSDSGVYTVTFADASGNSISYNFEIDKQAPTVELTSAYMDKKEVAISDKQGDTYTLMSFVKDPILNFSIIDNSTITRYCYYFEYGDGKRTEEICESYNEEIKINLTNSKTIESNIPLAQYLLENAFDGKITLYIYAKDILDNGNIEKATKVRFWADYKAPNANAEHLDLNVSQAISPEHEDFYHTIAVKVNDYSYGTIIECLVDVPFEFSDPRDDKLYDFKIKGCQDGHDGFSDTNPQFAQSFYNGVHLKFYKAINATDIALDGNNKPIEFEFLAQVDSQWMAIAIVDSVGNETIIINLPVFVQDAQEPNVLQVYKKLENDRESVLKATEYDVFNNGNKIHAYLANSDIKVVFDERIKEVRSCRIYQNRKDTPIYTGCANQDGYEYIDNKIYLEFIAPDVDNYTIWVFSVADFANNVSEEVVVVIDKKAPTVDFYSDDPNASGDTNLEYRTDSNKFDDAYKTKGYSKDVYKQDDQSADITINISYQKYLPSVTYKNYKKNADGTFEMVNDGELRSAYKELYLKLKQELVENKECKGKEQGYCYVLDASSGYSHYYFKSLKEIEDVTETIWKTIAEINNSVIGVYRIRYQVTDAAGNVSEYVYKNVFVNDRVKPDVDIYDSTNKNLLLYSGLAGTTPDPRFNGKLNKTVSFKGVTNSVSDRDTKIILYSCSIQNYHDKLCNIDQPLYNANYAGDLTGGKPSPSNELNMGYASEDGVYKIFVYDLGQYKVMENGTVYEGKEETVYALTHNVGYFYFALQKSEIVPTYHVYGNKYNSDYNSSDPNHFLHEKRDTNYYMITNENSSTDVYLVKCPAQAQSISECISVENDNAIGFSSYSFSKEVGSGNITATYRDINGAIIYEVKYTLYSSATETHRQLYLHETYYKIDADNQTISVCTMQDGKNICAEPGDGDIYMLSTMNAYIRDEEASREWHFRVADRFGNISADKGKLVVDNTPYLVNKNNIVPTGINYWFSVPSRVVTQNDVSYFTYYEGDELRYLINDPTTKTVFNAFDYKHRGNLNSEFFYAFASQKDALAYLNSIYRVEIEKQLDSGFTFYNAKGERYTFTKDNYSDADAVLKVIDIDLRKMVYKTFVKTNNFSSPEIQQIAYNRNDLGTTFQESVSMYKYVYLIITEKFDGGRATWDIRNYRISDKCDITNSETQKCVRVDLKIVDPNNPNLNIYKSESTNRFICISKNGGGTDNDCSDNLKVVPNGAIYVFIDADISEAYHTNYTYYGVTAYEESADIEYTQLGMYVPLGDRYIVRYTQNGDNYKVDPNGDMVWIDSQFKSLDELKHTNLYATGEKCYFNGSQHDECLYVTYFSRYEQAINSNNDTVYKPSFGGEYYYNYYTGTYMEKAQLITSLGVEYTFVDNKLVFDSNQADIALIDKNLISKNCVGFGCSYSINVVTNKKTYIELFNYSNSDIPSKLFEIQKISQDEIYSYAVLTIGGLTKNINDYIYVDAQGNYRCVIDIPMNEDVQVIVVRDRAGHEITITISHNSITPTLSYQKVDDTSTSSVNIHVSTTSKVTNLIKENVKVYKYDIENSRYPQEPFVNYSCYTLSSDMNNSFSTGYIQFMYNSSVDCQGVYKVEVKDQHGNSNYIEFVYSPYSLNNTYIVDEHTSVYKYEENSTTGLIVNGGFRFEINSKLDYAIISRYKPYSNLVLDENNLIQTITIKDFANANNTNLGSCTLTVIKNGSLHIVNIMSTTNNDCDGVYVVTVVNRFSQEIIENNLTHLQGAHQEDITHVLTYESIESIEIDTKAPDTTNDVEPYFNVHVYTNDNKYAVNAIDTLTLISQQTIAYTNEYVRIAWGGKKDHSLAYMQYKIYSVDEGADSVEWQILQDNVTYSGSYAVYKEFKLTQAGSYVCEFIFVDAVGNSDIDQKYSINITIKAPDVKFFEVKDTNPSAIYYPSVNKVYYNEQKIAGDVLLKCSKDGNQYKACGIDEYEYVMYVNGNEVRMFNNLSLDGPELTLWAPIGINSVWFPSITDKNKVETIISLVVRVKGKPDIETVLVIVVDKKAPEIDVDGNPYPGTTTFTGSVTISLSSEDATNRASIYKCDAIDQETNECMIYDYQNKNYVKQLGDLIKEINNPESTAVLDSSYSGYFMIIAEDHLKNKSSHYITLDNEAPTITVTTDRNVIVAHNMYTNATSVYAVVNDQLSKNKARFDIVFTPLNENDTVTDYLPSAGFTKEGKYVLTPIDGVGLAGKSITFYIYRQKPSYNIKTDQGENSHVVNKEAELFWEVSSSELVAPIINITINGAMYEATYDPSAKKYTGKTITDIGNHTFVVTDAAGNVSISMVTINNTNKVCINGQAIDVKMQAYYKTDELFIGNEPGMKYEVDDVIIFALPSQSGGNNDCESQNLLSYQTLDPANSHYLVETQRNANTLTNKEGGIDFVAYGFISKEAINEVNSVGGTVVVFVVTKDIANNQLGYSVGTNFFMKDPVGWVMIFVFAALCLIPTYRVFVKKKVRVI